MRSSPQLDHNPSMKLRKPDKVTCSKQLGLKKKLPVKNTNGACLFKCQMNNKRTYRQKQDDAIPSPSGQDLGLWKVGSYTGPMIFKGPKTLSRYRIYYKPMKSPGPKLNLFLRGISELGAGEIKFSIILRNYKMKNDKVAV